MGTYFTDVVQPLSPIAHWRLGETSGSVAAGSVSGKDGVYSGVVEGPFDSQSGIGGGLLLGGNFARGWVGGIEGGVTYIPYSNLDVIDLYFGGLFGGSLGRFDLFANIGLAIPVVNWHPELGPYMVDSDGWGAYMGVKVGGGVDFWIVDWLAVGVTGNCIWAYSITNGWDIYGFGGGEFEDMSRYTIQFGPKFKF